MGISKIQISRPGLTRNDIIIASALIIVLGGLMIWAVIDTRRRSRDASLISEVKQVQAYLEEYRRASGSYPSGLEDVSDGVSYVVTPKDCAPDADSICRSYSLEFELEGKVGALIGGVCTATPERLTCTPKP